MTNVLPLSHFPCFPKEARAGPCHSRKSPSLPRNRLKIQRIAARYRGRRRVGWWTLVLLLIVLLNISICFDIACEVYYTSACFGKEGLLIGGLDSAQC